MSSAYESLESAIKELDRLRRNLKKRATKQVRAEEERSLIKAFCLAWFNNHLPLVQSLVGEDLVQPPNEVFHALYAATDRDTLRSRYDEQLKVLRKELSGLRPYTLAPSNQAVEETGDEPPDFSSLVADPAMQAILRERWLECGICVRAKAPLAATVVMGGLLEALLLARVNRESNKSHIFKAQAAPKDRTTNKPLPLQNWTLRHYLDVAHELKWITRSAKDIGEVVRDYRNYIHPHKQLSHGVTLANGDAELFWEIAKGIGRQLVDNLK